jgi:hypothetical protein
VKSVGHTVVIFALNVDSLGRQENFQQGVFAIRGPENFESVAD